MLNQSIPMFSATNAWRRLQPMATSPGPLCASSAVVTFPGYRAVGDFEAMELLYPLYLPIEEDVTVTVAA